MAFTIALLAVGIYLNYWHDLYRNMVNAHAWSFRLTGWFMLFYGIPFLAVYLFQAVVQKDFSFLGKPAFWFLFVFALLVYSVRSSSYLWFQWLHDILKNANKSYFWYKVLHTAGRGLMVIIPIFIYWLIFDRKRMPLYGLTLKNYDTRPYLIMLAIMVPLVAWASFQGDFLQTYPRGGRIHDIDFSVISDRKYFLLYELVYGFDFFYVEFFFRGFLILAFMRLTGPGAILPMTAFYVLIHFGKPMGETISSFFGGTLLGIISYYSRSVAGGLIVHVGIAWMMEIGAFLSVHGKALFGGKEVGG